MCSATRDDFLATIDVEPDIICPKHSPPFLKGHSHVVPLPVPQIAAAGNPAAMHVYTQRADRSLLKISLIAQVLPAIGGLQAMMSPACVVLIQAVTVLSCDPVTPL